MSNVEIAEQLLDLTIKTEYDSCESQKGKQLNLPSESIT